jgi:uncharacterized protein (TIGR03083 family)
MSSTLKAIEADREALLTLCERLDDADWATASACPGWSVQDVVSHMACSFWLAVDMSKLPNSDGLLAERAADLYVDSRRSMTPDEVVADYASASQKGLELLAAVQDQDFDVPLGDVGTYHASVVPTAYAFEHYIHIRHDIFGPIGPLTREAPPSDELRISPTLDWIEAALPQQNSELLDGLDAAVEVHLTGVCGRDLRLGQGATGAHITSDSTAFIRWITQRSDWDSLGVDAQGDPAALDTVRKLTVF